MITLDQIDSADSNTTMPPPTSSTQTNTSNGDASAYFSRKYMICSVCLKEINPQSDTEVVDPLSDTKAIDLQSKLDQRCFVSLSPDGVVDDFFHWKCLPLNPAATYRNFHDVLSKIIFCFVP